MRIWCNLRSSECFSKNMPFNRLITRGNLVQMIANFNCMCKRK